MWKDFFILCFQGLEWTTDDMGEVPPLEFRGETITKSPIFLPKHLAVSFFSYIWNIGDDYMMDASANLGEEKKYSK